MSGVTAGFGWSPEEGMWVLRLASPELQLEPVAWTWPAVAGPPSLMDRYDALAELGYAVVQGGPEAWRWTEHVDEEGRPYLMALTEVRPLTDREVADYARTIEG
ncbi:DUF6303 family protein [Streptomyces sp. NPDC002547]